MGNMNEDEQGVIDLLRSLKPSDLSILDAALATPDSQIATVRNSPNDMLWSALERLGLAQEVVLDIEIPPMLKNFHPKSFAITDRGNAEIPRLLKLAREETVNSKRAN